MERRKGSKAMFEILKECDYAQYEEFALNHPNGTFTQSVNWAKVKKGWGHAVSVSKDNAGKIQGGMALLTKKAPGIRANFLYAPRGPVMDYDNEEVFADLVAGVKCYAKQVNAFEFKMDPMVLSDNTAFIAMAKKYGFLYDENQGDHDTIQRRCNYMIDLEKYDGDGDKLIMSFHQKWRYNIRLAMRKGVECRVCGKEAIPDFYKIYAATAKRDGYTPRPQQYFYYFLDALGEHVRLYMCYYQGEPVSGAITTNYAGKVCYVYGASSNEHRNVMPNHLMQWTMMQWALETNCKIYDFQGIPMDLSGADHMNGVYLFKKGFNGDVVLFAAEFDMIFHPIIKKCVDTAQKAVAAKNKWKRKMQKK